VHPTWRRRPFDSSSLGSVESPLIEPGEFYMPYPVEVTFGGATVFVLDVARYERI